MFRRKRDGLSWKWMGPKLDPLLLSNSKMTFSLDDKCHENRRNAKSPLTLSLSLSLSLWRLKGSELMRLYLPFFMGQTELKDGWIMDASHCRYVCRYNGPDWLSTADADDDDDMTYKWSTLSFCPYIISIHVTLFSLILLFFSLAPKCHSLLLLYLIGKLSCCCYCWVNNTPAFRRRFKGASNTHR